MAHILSLLLPALIPSWRFFDTIAPSPRIEFAVLKSAQDVAQYWQEFRPRPAHLSPGSLLSRMFYNARWNESLFLVSCAERLMQNPEGNSEREIMQRIGAELKRTRMDAPCLQFRLVFVTRNNSGLQRYVTYTSQVQHLTAGTQP